MQSLYLSLIAKLISREFESGTAADELHRYSPDKNYPDNKKRARRPVL